MGVALFNLSVKWARGAPCQDICEDIWFSTLACGIMFGAGAVEAATKLKWAAWLMGAMFELELGAFQSLGAFEEACHVICKKKRKEEREEAVAKMDLEERRKAQKRFEDAWEKKAGIRPDGLDEEGNPSGGTLVDPRKWERWNRLRKELGRHPTDREMEEEKGREGNDLPNDGGEPLPMLPSEVQCSMSY